MYLCLFNLQTFLKLRCITQQDYIIENTDSKKNSQKFYSKSLLRITLFVSKKFVVRHKYENMAERGNNQSKETTSNTDKFLARHETIGTDSKGNFMV